jgi:hypothetical protein
MQMVPEGVPKLLHVDDRDHRIPFRFTGKPEKLTLTIDRPKLSLDDEKERSYERIGWTNQDASAFA